MGGTLIGRNNSSSRGATVDPRHAHLVASMRERYAAAERRRDASAKQALFREAVYLNILPEEFIDPA